VDVETAWELLERAGVPCSTTSAATADLTDIASVVRATREVLARPERLDERQRVSLLAWLGAWSSAFPSSFREAFGDTGQALVARAAHGVDAPDRYLKLRRIAREKLLAVL
jgi:hypothetical protein